MVVGINRVSANGATICPRREAMPAVGSVSVSTCPSVQCVADFGD